MQVVAMSNANHFNCLEYLKIWWTLCHLVALMEAVDPPLYQFANELWRQAPAKLDPCEYQHQFDAPRLADMSIDYPTFHLAFQRPKLHRPFGQALKRDHHRHQEEN